jgi:hypothetical protein
MKRLSVAILGVALMSAAPLSIHWSHANHVSVSVALNVAAAADLGIEGRYHRRAYRHRYYAGYYRDYDPYCGGPYVGGGWNGGTYYGGPWMDLRCYGIPYY